MSVSQKLSVSEVKLSARHKWRGILVALGVDEAFLRNRHGPCPACGGTDRFRFHDREGDGEYICSPDGSGCGAGDGLSLLQKVHGWEFRKALNEVANVVGVAQPTSGQAKRKPSGDWMKKLIQETMAAAKPVAQGDPVQRYLVQRGFRLAHYPATLLTHESLGYFEEQNGKSRLVATYPAMLGVVQGASGEVVALHRTYLTTAGTKAAVSDPKRLLNKGIKGAAVRLFEVQDEIGVAEGIETALAAHLETGVPVWSTLNAGNMADVWLPESVKRVHIFADGQFAGLKPAFALAHRLSTGQHKKEVLVHTLRNGDGRFKWSIFRSSDLPLDFADIHGKRLKVAA